MYPAKITIARAIVFAIVKKLSAYQLMRKSN